MMGWRGSHVTESGVVSESVSNTFTTRFLGSEENKSQNLQRRSQIGNQPSTSDRRIHHLSCTLVLSKLNRNHCKSGLLSQHFGTSNSYLESAC